MATKPTVYIVEDEEPTLKYLRELVRDALPDHRVRGFNSVDSLEARLEKGDDAEILISDYRLAGAGGRQGTEAIRLFKEKYEHGLVLLITGFKDEFDEASKGEIQVDGYLPKPFNDDTVKVLLQAYARHNTNLVRALESEMDARAEAKAQKHKAEFARGVAHESKNNLNGTVDSLENLKAGMIDSMMYVLNTLKNDSENLSKLIYIVSNARPILGQDELAQHRQKLAGIEGIKAIDALDFTLAGLSVENVNYIQELSIKYENESELFGKIKSFVTGKYWIESGITLATQTRNYLTAFLNGARHRESVYDNLVLRQYIESTVLPQLEGRFYRHKINVTINEDDGLPEVYTHVPALTECLKNILNNAVEAIHRDGNIDISLIKYIDGVGVRISNDGPEIEDPSKIGTEEYTTKDNGTGFGLVDVVRKTEKVLQGKMTFESNPDNTYFEIKLPCNIEVNIQ